MKISDVSAVRGTDTFERPIQAGNAIATVRSSYPVKVLTVRTTAFEPMAADGGGARIEPVKAVDGGRALFIHREVA